MIVGRGSGDPNPLTNARPLITSESRHRRYLGKLAGSCILVSVHVQECPPKHYPIVTQFGTLADEAGVPASKGPTDCPQTRIASRESRIRVLQAVAILARSGRLATAISYPWWWAWSNACWIDAGIRPRLLMLWPC